MPTKTYEDGLIEGRLVALENIAAAHKDRLDGQSRRLRLLEKIVWATGGIMVFLQSWPVIGRAAMAFITAAGTGSTGP
jgi:hypothetical protein